MRYEDASQTGSAGSDVNARDDSEHLAGNDFGPATGNLITGSGTVSGATGTDMVGPGGHITGISGPGGSDTSFDANGKLEVAGQYGTLTIDAEGNYTYVRNPDSPEGVSETFTYTLADAAGATDSANLVINIGNLPMLQAQGDQTTIQTNNGVVVLPAGVELSDVRVVGRNLVVTLPDGSTMVIPDGAIFVPQLVVNGVEVPASNLAALLIDSEPKPAAGDTSPTSLSSGGNFEVPVQPLDPGVPLGDLIPPTELFYTPPDIEEIFDAIDKKPVNFGNIDILIDDDTLPNGLAGGPGDGPDAVNIAGFLAAVSNLGGDPPFTFSLQLTTAPAGFQLVSGGLGIALLQQNGVTVRTISFNEATGEYEVTQNARIVHPAGGDENDLVFVLTVTVTDSDGDNATGTITITYDDDTPVVDNVTVQGGVTLDETAAGTAAGFPINGTTAGPIIVNSSGGFGADGPAVANATVFGIGLTGGVTSLASGLATAIGDHPITLVQIDSDTIQGQYTDGGTQVAFIVQMNGDGSVTLTQNVPLEHLVDGPAGPAHDDSLSLSGLVNATVTLTDFDGDSATRSAPIGGNLIFKDDGPDAAVNEQAALDTIVLDETRPEGTDTSGAGAPSGDASATANLADNFILPADFGADGAGTVTYQLLLSANGIGSGLYALQPADTSNGDGDGIGQGAQITLSLSGNTITGSAGGVNYFTIALDANTGVVTFTQLSPIWHPTPGASFDEAASLLTESAADIRVQQTVTDSDGDFDTAAVNIGRGVFSIQDDGPNAAVDPLATLDTVVLDESRPEGTDTAGAGAPSGDASASVNFADNFVAGGDFGEDGPGSVTYQLLLSANGIGSGLFALDAADISGGDGDGIGQGAEITLSQIGNTITGSAGGTDYFTISIDPATGVVTFSQLSPIWHPTPGASFDEAAALNTAAAANVQVQQTITDADGDTDTATVNIGQGVFSIQDDGPNAAVDPQATLDTVVLDETRPEGTDTAGAGAPSGDASATVNFADNFVAGGDFGEDGPGSVSYQLLLSANGIASGLYALDAADTSAGDGDGIGQGAQITLSQVGNTITGSAGGTDYFTISINPGTGVVTFSQLNPIWHPTPGSSFDEAAALNTAAAANVQVQQTITDADGDTDTATVDIGQGVFSIQDDGPDASVNGQAALDTIVLDETRPEGTDTAGAGAPTGDASATANFADNFNAPSDFGADGPGSVNYSLLLSANGIASGLFALDAADTSAGDGDGIGQGAAITLSQVGNTVTGSAGGTDYFTISINSGTGVVTFSQLQPIWHPTPGSSFDEAAVLSTSLASNLQVIQSITDADGDVDSASINIGQGVFSIQDDGPDASLNTGASLDTLALDESRPEGTDTAGGVAPTGDASVTANFADNFNGPADFGADGPGSVRYALVLSANGIGSGLFAIDPTDTTAGDGDGIGRGTEITLSLSGNTVTGSANGINYFTITIDPVTGVATFTQLDNIWHPTPGASYDEAAILNTVAAANFQVVQTITDADGDVDTAALNIGQGVFSIQDDGPAASPDTDTVSGQGGTATGNVITDLAAGDAGDSDTGADDVGEDTPGRVSFIDNANDGAAGVAVPTGGAGVDIAGQFGTLHIAANGDYTYTRSGGLGGGQSETFNYTLIDADGDTIVSTLTIQIADTVPVATTSSAIVDDDGLSGGIANGPNDDNANAGETLPGNPSEAIFNGTLGGTPGDGATTFLFLASLNGTTASVGTETVTYSLSNPVTGGFNTLTATVTGGARNGTVLFTVNITNPANGDYTVTLLDNVMHPTQDGVIGSDDTENNVSVVINYQMRDADGDNSAAAGQLTINFDDDTPDAQLNGSAQLDTIVLDETRPAGTDTAGGVAPTGLASATANFADNFVIAPIPYGADGPGTTAYSLFLSANGIASGLFALDPADTTAGDGDGIGRGASITLSLSGNTITGSVGATNYFTISIDPATGVVTFTQLLPIWHPTPGSSYDEAANLSTSLASNMQVVQSITDADGDTDTVSLNIGQGVFSIQDDGPDAATSGVAVGTVTLDETRAEGTDTAGGSPPTGDASNTINFATNFVNGGAVDYGADGAGSTVYSLSLTGTNVNSGLYALDNTDMSAGDGDGFGQGSQIVLNLSGNTITGSVGATNYFTITINPTTGVVTFTQLNNIWHPTAGSSAAALDEAATLNTLAANLVQVVQTVTDADGDVDTASINIGQGVFIIQDDGPRFGVVDTTVNIDNTAPINSTGNDLHFVLGTDTPNGGSGNQNPDDLSVSNFTVSVNGTTLDPSDFSLTAGAETATTANYTFQFTYDTGSGGETTAHGTLVFHKDTGTYDVTLDSAVQGFSILSTGTADAGDFVSYQVPSGGSGAPEVTVAALDTDFFVQFSGVAEPSSGTGANNLFTTQGTAGSFDPVTTANFANLELFTQAMSTIQVSSSAAGVAGNTVQGGEVLDFNLYATDPAGTLGGVPTANSTSMFVVLDGIGGSEDMIVVLKLYDTVTGQYTTKAMMVQNPDIIQDASTLVGTPYEGLIPGANDGIIIFEANDYQAGNTNLVIVGAQIAGSDEGITGTATNFNGALDTASSGTQDFSIDVSDAPFKITSIGFLTTSSEDQSATIDFDVTIHDADGDTATTSITVNIGDPVTTLAAAKTSGPSTMEALSSHSLLVSETQEVERVAANSNTVTLAAAVAAAGIVSTSAAASGPDIQDAHAITFKGVDAQVMPGFDTSERSVGEASAFAPWHGGGFEAGANTLATSSHTAIAAAHIGELASALSIGSGPGALLEATDIAAMTQAPVQATGMKVAMAAVAESLVPAEAAASAQGTGTVEQIIADALHGGGNGPDINAMLNALPGAGLGENAGLQGLATQLGHDVPNGDTGHGGVFTFDVATIITTEAMVLHHDAVQPVANG